jgi:hypothetical protein|nr:MAG TPA: hypothetical protein [Bacteriophage sp.]
MAKNPKIVNHPIYNVSINTASEQQKESEDFTKPQNPKTADAYRHGKRETWKRT